MGGPSIVLTLGSLHLKHHLCSYVMAHLSPRVSRYPDWLSLDEMGKSLAAPTELWCFFSCCFPLNVAFIEDLLVIRVTFAVEA